MGFIDDIVSDQVAPPWLQQGAYQQGPGIGGRYLQTLGIELDTIALRARQAAVVGLPGIGDPSGLFYIGNDRLLKQSASESNASFALRCSGAFDSWRIGGSDWGVLQQVLTQFIGFAGGLPPARIVDNSQYWSFYPAGATTSVPPLHNTTVAGNWNWDNHGVLEWTGLFGSGWWRYWLIIDSFGGSTWTNTEGNWGDAGNWGDTTASWGLSIPPGIFVTIRQLLRSWQGAHAWCRWIVVNFQSGNYTPDGANATPDGTWSKWGKLVGGSWVQSRDTSARYVDGVLDGS